MKRMGSENEKTQQGLWNESERCMENHNPGLKSQKRQKPPAKSFIWADELKRHFGYTLKPSKCSNTEITKFNTMTADSNDQESLDLGKLRPNSKNKFLTDMNIENIFMNSEYFKLKTANAASMSFCSGENGENRWTIDTKGPPFRKTATMISGKGKESPVEDVGKTKKLSKKVEELTQAQELKYIKETFHTVLEELRQLKRDFGLVRMDLKALDKVLRGQKQVSGKSKPNIKECDVSDANNINLKLGKFSEEVEKAAQELRDFIDSNRTLLIDNEEILEYPNFDRIISNLHRLNEAAYQPKIIQTSKGAKFEVPRELPISLYSDGILLRDNDFRSYCDIKTSFFLRDIEDGFFPGELWPEFPYGVPFQVTDKRFEVYNSKNPEAENKFPGNGCRLGSNFDGKPSSMVYLEPLTKALMGAGEPEQKRISAFSIQDQKNLFRMTGLYQMMEKTHEEPHGDTIPKLMSLRVRLGNNSEGFLHLNLMSNDKMNVFQDVLFSKLCERYHDEYVKDIEFNDNKNKYDQTVPDFEIHVYGHKPLRLSENLNLYPSECGIVDKCVINITEI